MGIGDERSDVGHLARIPFTIRNNGDREQALRVIYTSCNCTRVNLEKTAIGPGESVSGAVLITPTAPGYALTTVRIGPNLEESMVIRGGVMAIAPLIVRPKWVMLQRAAEGEELVAEIEVLVPTERYGVQDLEFDHPEWLRVRILDKRPVASGGGDLAVVTCAVEAESWFGEDRDVPIKVRAMNEREGAADDSISVGFRPERTVRSGS